MQPLQKFQKSLNFLRAHYVFIGQDVLADKFRRGKVFYLICFLFVIEISFLFIDLLATDDLSEATRVTQMCMLIGGVQILTKYYFLTDLQAMRPVVTFFESIYRQNSQPTDEYYGICRRYARFIELLFRIAAVNYGGIIVFIMISGLIESYLKLEPAFYFYFPIFHEYTLWQVVSLDVFISIAGFYCIVVMPAGDLFFYLVVANFTMIPLIIALQMDELSARLEQRQAGVTEIKRRWMHYIRIHQKYVRYGRV